MTAKKTKLEDAQPADEAPIDAVIVIKDVAEDGTISTRILINGSVQVTEVQTLLELGVRGWRESIGLTP